MQLLQSPICSLQICCFLLQDLIKLVKVRLKRRKRSHPARWNPSRLDLVSNTQRTDEKEARTCCRMSAISSSFEVCIAATR